MKKKAPAGRPETTRGGGDAGAGDESHLVRLNKYLADNGVASRRHADQLIADGAVLVDGEMVTALGTKIDPQRQRVEVDGVVLRPEGEHHRYFLLSKPKNVVCTNDEREGRRRAIDLITDRKKGRIYTVGRLDEDTTGLVILTNDGEFAHRVGHPRYEVPKVYSVTLKGRIDEEQLYKLRAGVRVAEFKAEFDWVRLVKRSERFSTLLVRLNEGKNREIRRVFARLGLPVRSLHRQQIGPVSDRGLKVGHWRPLTRDEVQALLAVSHGEVVLEPRERRRRGGKSSPRGNARRATGHGKGSPGGARAPHAGGRPPGRRDRGKHGRP